MTPVETKLLTVMTGRSASGLKELSRLTGYSTDEVKTAAYSLHAAGRLKVNRLYDNSWKISNARGAPTAPDAPELVDPAELSVAELREALSELEREMAAILHELRTRGEL